MAPKSARADSAETIADREKLAPFLEEHTFSSVIEADLKDKKQRVLQKPWNDSSFALFVPEHADDLAEALNNVILPERLTAIYHKDSRKLEVIWTAYSLEESQKELIGRKFNFHYLGNAHKCHFSRCSERLLIIAENLIPLRMSYTSFRNLQSFNAFILNRKNSNTNNAVDQPICFWIENIDWNIDKIIEIVNNINFYLSYYDNDSPTVLIHPAGEDEKPSPRNRYITGSFPKNINGKQLDNNLVSFWNASSSGDAARKFQYYYRIIEYASFFYLESSARITVKRILSAPDAIDDIESVTEKLMAAFQTSKLDEYAKFAQIIQDTVDPKILWSEMSQNIPAFSKDIKFDGGFLLKSVISTTTKESSYLPKGLETFTKAIRDIRNALSHGRDFKSSLVITPTARNLKALQPWVHLIAAAAGQVVLYKHVS
jgi:hypothetical protein